MKRELYIQNLKCSGCANTITKEISKIEDIKELSINEEKSLVSFNAIEDETLKKVVVRLKELGYPVVDEENSLLTQAKSFVSCAVGRMTK